ncbi:MAG: sigma-70 family RNA polymerase sigma factor [Spirosomaceae bacterium]|jgi:RNA polymerase sigma factor (sigma-70 family)|nr:sigma-70 family RNA polymerase sigma factor [Spirosomataceae bacterium]
MARLSLTTHEEVNLWNQFRQDDEKSFARLYQCYVQLLYNYCTQFSADKALIKDCIHDLFVELWQHRHTLGDTTSVRYYLMASIKRKLVRHLNAQQKNTSSEEIPLEYHHLYTASAETYMIAQEDYLQTNRSLNSALEKLPRRQREAVFLKFYVNMTNEEISTFMKINIQSVYNLVFGALTSLKKQLTVELVTV